MSRRGLTGRRKPVAGAPARVGIFGNLGSGNIGNDASMESVLTYLSTDHPDAVVDAMCPGPDRVTGRYGIGATYLYWYQKYEDRVSGVPALALKVLGKGIDTFRTPLWVSRHDAVIVPGMGVLEATLPVRPWGFPYAMFLLGASGRLFGTKVALVSVGAERINQPATRWLYNSAARLASYRSYRDAHSREAMRRRGLDVSRDRVYPDLVFSFPMPPYEPGDAQIVGVGVMTYQGSNDDRKKAEEIYAAYIENMKGFIRWLVDSNRKVRLLLGDTANDHVAVQEIMADLREQRPALEPGAVTAQPVTSFAELIKAMAPVGTVVATRFHNVLCALKLEKPTISLGYARKNVELMAGIGMSEFCQPADSLDLDLLIKQFTELESRSPDLRQVIAERNMTNAQLLDQQFAVLSEALFGTGGPSGKLSAGLAAEHVVEKSGG
jgi:polysaccharide pyruvyl transferase WcaK-like protein